MIKKQKTLCILTDDGLYDWKAFYKLKNCFHLLLDCLKVLRYSKYNPADAFPTFCNVNGISVDIPVIRGGSRAAATTKMECFVKKVNGWKQLTVITKHSILDVTAALDLSLVISAPSELTFSAPKRVKSRIRSSTAQGKLEVQILLNTEKKTLPTLNKRKLGIFYGKKHFYRTYKCFNITNFKPILFFVNPWKHQKTRFFLIFSGRIEIELQPKMGQ